MKKSIKNKKERGITLVALVVTIIVLLILAGIAINMVLGEDGIIGRAKYASELWNQEDREEKIQMAVFAALEKGKGTITTEDLINELRISISDFDDNSINGNDEEGWKLNGNDKTLYISNDGRITEVLDRTGIKLGDYVEYSAGTWTEEDINKLGSLYCGENIPDSNNTYKFGGFKVGQSRDIGIVRAENNISQLDMSHNGWRVLKINLDGSIDLIHAGASEYYYHPTRCVVSKKTDYQRLAGSAVRSRYILSGEKNQEEGLQFTYEGVEPRDWKMYENNYAIEGSAHVSTRTEILAGYWQGAGQQWQRLIGIDFWTEGLYYNDIGAISWCKYDSNVDKANLFGYGRDASGGIRIVITLKPECVLESKENDNTHTTRETAWNLVLD